MEGPLNVYTALKAQTTDFDELKKLMGQDSDKDISPVMTSNLKIGENVNVSSDEDQAPVQRVRKRIQKFTDSDSDVEKENDRSNLTNIEAKEDSDSETTNSITHKRNNSKSRIRLNNSDSDSPDDLNVNKNEEQQIRMKNKRDKMKQQFKSLLSSREKRVEPVTSDKYSSNDDSDTSNGDISSIKTIKQKIKDSMSMIPSICDPDTSDEESSKINKHVNKSRPMKERKSTKPTSPKPMRMSAKQAMENMHKIKSESNRMLREKEVSLPYHRPKALSLKDIMNRRKPAVSSDGKALPIKMNEEQLKQYAQLLEQRQKEMMELCKSDTEDEEAADVEESLPEIEKISSDNTERNIETDKICENSENISFDGTDAQTTDKDTIVDEQSPKNALNVIPIETSTIPEANRPDKDTEIHSNDTNINDESSGEQDSLHTDIKLIYNDSTEEANTTNANSAESIVINHEDNPENILHTEKELEEITTVGTEPDSQLIGLHYDTELSEKCTEEFELIKENNVMHSTDNEHLDKIDVPAGNEQEDFLSDDDDHINMDDIDKIIENAELIENKNLNSPMLNREPVSLHIKPKLAGAPGMVIDLDGCDPIAAKKLSGVELLKERFTYFARLKTPEELEREREKKVKPGALHVKLKQELEEQIAEQRSLEWAKRLENEKQQHIEMNAVRGDESDVEDDIDKIEAKLNENEEKEISSESEEELIEDDIEMKDKPRKHNPMLEDEAEESECEENEAVDENKAEIDGELEGDGELDAENEDSDDSSDESSESEEEETSKPKKGRILKAFEDSDDESIADKVGAEIPATESTEGDKIALLSSQSASQDDELQLAQRPKSVSDIFSSQDALSSTGTNDNKKDETNTNDVEIATQTFSILDSKPSDAVLKSPGEIRVLSASQPYHDPNLDALASGLSLDINNSQQTTQVSQSQAIGEDILALCTGKFYDNEFVSQTDENQYVSISQESSTDDFVDENLDEINKENGNLDHIDNSIRDIENNSKAKASKELSNSNKPSSDDGNLLKSILDELDDPEFDAPKPNKFFTGATRNKGDKDIENSQLKKKFIIDSDDEADTIEQPKKKKLKKKKPEKRALQISDDEEEDEQSEQEEADDMSDIENDTEKIVEYDSEENEIEVKPAENSKKKRKATDFFENEAELTSEDEWVGSGDEDEAGLDRMEREEGDNEVFHQGKLRKELGQIHMRDVLDQDKREVRMLQELLFEDGDLGDGHRQRKFRWRNADGDEEMGTIVDEFGNTQEEEFESEEQWRKQRHERAMFLRQMQNKEEEDVNISVNRTTIIKANLSSKTMSSLLLEVNQSKTEVTESPVVPEKKTAKDIPSPKKSFAVFQQNYHGSLLTRGRGALARLAALATPLATDDDAPKIGSLAPSSKRNFVFAALTPDEKPKVTMKRKADTNIGTPKLIKKMKTEDKQNKYKNSLLDHLKAL